MKLELSPIIKDHHRSAKHITALGEAAYGVSTPLPHILQMHRDMGVPGSFFVPGYVGDCYLEEIGAIATTGYEIAHHGYLHEICFASSDEQQRTAFVKGARSKSKCNILWGKMWHGKKLQPIEY